MPTIAKLVDECRELFGEVKVRFARENGIERGNEIRSVFDGAFEKGFLGSESGFDWRLLCADIAERERKEKERAEQKVLGSPSRNGRATRYK
jgi:hypothetical protein